MRHRGKSLEVSSDVISLQSLSLLVTGEFGGDAGGAVGSTATPAGIRAEGGLLEVPGKEVDLHSVNL